jgi:hypothetical protein
LAATPESLVPNAVNVAIRQEHRRILHRRGVSMGNPPETLIAYVPEGGKLADLLISNPKSHDGTGRNYGPGTRRSCAYSN